MVRVESTVLRDKLSIPNTIQHRVHVCLEQEDGPGELLLLHGVALKCASCYTPALAAAVLDLDQVDA